ncbi:MAG: hypothetical protein FD149_2231 [Rhodospirillaceae bacterium]|nr:MAG: hypothetical protein FD149_2231 [Rhodospirillaceae bacterium]
MEITTPPLQVRPDPAGRFATCMVEMTMQMPGDDQRRAMTCLPLRWLAPTIGEITTVAEDGKQRAMTCLPLRRFVPTITEMVIVAKDGMKRHSGSRKFFNYMEVNPST